MLCGVQADALEKYSYPAVKKNIRQEGFVHPVEAADEVVELELQIIWNFRNDFILLKH
jgi:hypothetical protein